MGDVVYSLAIETSGRVGSVTLGRIDRGGRGEEVLETAVLPDPRRPPRHRIDLMPTIAGLCGRYGVGPGGPGGPGDLEEVYVCVGPGSFTGLRIGITTAKTLGQVLGVRLVGVGALDVWAQSVGEEEVGGGWLAVCLNVKGQTAYAGLYEGVGDGKGGRRWVGRGEPGVKNVSEIITNCPRPVVVVSDGATLGEGEVLGGGDREGVRFLTRGAGGVGAMSEAVWRLGREAARGGRCVGYEALGPVYARPPEAQEVWDRRYGEGRGPGDGVGAAGRAAGLAC